MFSSRWGTGAGENSPNLLNLRSSRGGALSLSLLKGSASTSVQSLESAQGGQDSQHFLPEPASSPPGHPAQRPRPARICAQLSPVHFRAAQRISAPPGASQRSPASAVEVSSTPAPRAAAPCIRGTTPRPRWEGTRATRVHSPAT